jgi:hypothetical protein
MSVLNVLLHSPGEVEYGFAYCRLDGLLRHERYPVNVFYH